MPSENITLINRIYEAFETRDFLALLNLLSPEVHITQCPEVPWGGVFQGLEVAKVFFGKLATYLDSHVTIERIIDAGDRVAVIGRTYGTARSTGRKFDVAIMHLWGFKDRLPFGWKLPSTFRHEGCARGIVRNRLLLEPSQCGVW